MKRKRLALVATLIAGLGVGVFAWRDRTYMTPAQELLVYSLGNRYIEAFCNNPSELAYVLQGSFIPQSLLLKSQDFLSEMNTVEGECLGNDKAQIQQELLHALRRLPRELIASDMATEYGVGDFIECLGDVEKSFYNLRDASTRIFECVDQHLDIRSFWYRAFISKKNSNYPDDDLPSKPNPISYPDDLPISAPVPMPMPVSPLDQCIDSCFQNQPSQPEAGASDPMNH